ncbi:hypothetical protein BKG70_09685 [Mycobacteroides chelonae]|nr:hypothetical protein [Mycobacteroides chelonae]OHT72939.1 hypothetical protein BKG66_09025 [Mycobacteroides chelonae]OHT74523.1 hypothetical protein BKG67_08940 [Mycobacteroides chelonae]OHT89587.1 hypothetical protein BKG70_09685 [Mycobacteroides chelonae]
MIGPSAWQVMQVVRIVFLLCFLPVLLYRVWRLWRHPASAPAIAITAFGVVMWFWLLLLSDFLWSVLPVQIRAASMAGWFVTTVAACVQIFVLGISGSVSPARMRRAWRIVLGVTAVVLVVVGVAAQHSQALLATEDLKELTNALLDGADSGAVVASLVSNGYLTATLVQLIWAGFRHADSTPVGTGLGLLAVASSFEVVCVFVGGIWRPLTGGHDVISTRYGMALQSVSGGVGITLMAIGFLWPPVVLRIQARRHERRLRPLHDEFARLFPQLFPPMESQIRLSDKIFEWSTHIQDGLTLLAQGRELSLETDTSAPNGKSARALAVANWIVGQSDSGFSGEWLHAPGGVSDEAWVLAIADAYRNHAEVQVHPEVNVSVCR